MSKATGQDFRVSAETLATHWTLQWTKANDGVPVRVTGLMVRNLVRGSQTVARLHDRPADGNRVHAYTAAEAYAIGDALSRKRAGAMGRAPFPVTVPGAARPAKAPAKAKATAQAPGGGSVRVRVKPAPEATDGTSDA